MVGLFLPPLLFVFPACVFLAAKERPAVVQKHLSQIGDASVGMECILQPP